jgi:hypothetical protein
MSEHAQDGSIKPEHVRPKGEYKMMLLLFIICAALFVDSLNSPGFPGKARAGQHPRLVAGHWC